MRNPFENTIRRIMVHPWAPSKWLARIGYRLHAMANNYNFDMNTNGERALIEAIAPHDIDMVFDVGAYKGHWSLCALPILQPNAIHAFEPVPQSFAKLKRNLADCQEAHLHQLALGGERQTIQIAYNGEKPTRSGFHARTMKYSNLEIIDVEVVAGSQFCDDNGIATIDMLKIDAEGHEKHVLNGFAPMLESGRIRAIQFEYSPVGTIYDVSLWELYELFERNGYVVGKVYPDGVGFAPFDSLDETVLGPNYCAILHTEQAMLTDTHAKRRSNFDYITKMGGPSLG